MAVGGGVIVMMRRREDGTWRGWLVLCFGGSFVEDNGSRSSEKPRSHVRRYRGSTGYSYSTNSETWLVMTYSIWN